MEKLKGVIVGAGIIGSDHAHALSQVPYVEIVGICDLNKDKAAEVAEKNGIPGVYTDYNEMLSASNCDFVTVATPDHIHAGPAIAAAKAKKHILLEKPFATSREDIINMRRTFKETGVRVMTDLHNRANYPFTMAKEIINSGNVGKVYSMYVRLNDNKSVATNMLSWSSESSVIWFLGSHSLDILSWMCGSRPKTVYALTRSGILRGLGVDTADMYQTSIEFENGVIAQMENGWIVPNGNTNIIDFKANIMCEKGSFNINTSNSDTLHIITDEYTQTPTCFAKVEQNGKLRGFCVENVQYFAEALFYNKPFNVTVDEAADGCLGLLAILDSASTGKAVNVEYEA